MDNTEEVKVDAQKALTAFVLKPLHAGLCLALAYRSGDAEGVTIANSLIRRALPEMLASDAKQALEKGLRSSVAFSLKGKNVSSKMLRRAWVLERPILDAMTKSERMEYARHVSELYDKQNNNNV